MFSHDEETWSDALAAALGPRRLACVELGTAGTLTALLGGAGFLAISQLLGSDVALIHSGEHLEHYADHVREMSGADIGLAVRARERAGDTAVSIAISGDGPTIRVTRTAFLGGEEGRRRAALVACAELWRRLRRG